MYIALHSLALKHLQAPDNIISILIIASIQITAVKQNATSTKYNITWEAGQNVHNRT